MAATPRSSVRTRTTSSTGTIHTFPSPILPVWAAFTTAPTTFSTSVSSTRISSFDFGTRSTLYSAPRYSSVCPRWRPCPRVSDNVTPLTSSAWTAANTSSTRCGFTTATMSFIVLSLPCPWRPPLGSSATGADVPPSPAPDRAGYVVVTASPVRWQPNGASRRGTGQVDVFVVLADARRLRREHEVGVAVRAELRHVETLELDLRRHTDRLPPLVGGEDEPRHAPRPH